MQIGEISFTARELDVISCIISLRGAKKIGSILLISPRTVETHIQKILLKIKGSTKESIIDFVEKSSKFKFINDHYLSLLVNRAFEQQLMHISYLVKKNKVSCYIDHNGSNDILQSLTKHFKIAGIEISTNDNNSQANKNLNYKYNLYILSQEKKHVPIDELLIKNQENSMFLIMDYDTNKAVTGKIFNKEILDFSVQKQYFNNVFKILANLVSDIDYAKFVTQFEQLQTNIINSKSDDVNELLDNIQYNYIGATKETNDKIKSNNSLQSIFTILKPLHYLIITFATTMTIIGIFGGIWYLARGDYNIENKYQLVEDKISQFAEKLTTDQTSTQKSKDNRLDILSAQQAIDDLYNKYQKHLSQAALQSKFTYLSCVLAGHYRYNNEYNDSLVDDYLKSEYLSLWQRNNYVKREFYDYVASQILNRVANHYNNRYGLTDNDTAEIIKDKLSKEKYALEDYILLNYYLSRGYMSSSMKSSQSAGKIKLVERYLDIALLGKEYNMYEACSAEKNKLIFERDKIKISIMELTKTLKYTFPIIRDETSLVSIIEKIESEKQDKQKLKEIIESFLSMHQGKELQLKEIIDGFLKLESDEHKYVNHYKPWKKTQEEYLVPKDALFNSVVMCKENLYTQAVLMNYYTLLYHDNTEKLQQEHRTSLSNSLQELNQFLGHREIQDKWLDTAIKAQKKKIITAIKDLGEVYYDNNIVTQLKIITDLIQKNEFDSSIRSKVNFVIEVINRQNFVIENKR